MAEITAEDLANLVGAANNLVQTFENKEADIDSKIALLSQVAISKLSGDFFDNAIYVDALNGDDGNSGVPSSPVKTLEKAFSKTSPLFRRNTIYLRGDYDYVINGTIDGQDGVNIEVIGLDADTTDSIRSGSTDNRPTISLGITGIVPNDGESVTALSERVGIYPGRGIKIKFSRIRYIAPQGFESDLDKSMYHWGPCLIMWQDQFFQSDISFSECYIRYGLGGVIASVGVSEINLGLAKCDVHFNPVAENKMCRHLVRRNYETRVSYSEVTTLFYDSNSGQQLSNTQARESIFSVHAFDGEDSTSESRGVTSFKSFSRVAMGLV